MLIDKYLVFKTKFFLSEIISLPPLAFTLLSPHYTRWMNKSVKTLSVRSCYVACSRCDEDVVIYHLSTRFGFKNTAILDEISWGFKLYLQYTNSPDEGLILCEKLAYQLCQGLSGLVKGIIWTSAISMNKSWTLSKSI